MGRKKKKEELEIYHTPFESTNVRLPKYELSPYSIEPEIIETTSLGDLCKRYVQSPFATGTSVTHIGFTGEIRRVHYPLKHWEPYATTLDYEDLMKKIEKEEKPKMNIVSEKSLDERNIHGML